MKKTKNIFISLVLAVILLAISAISVVSLNPTAYAAAATDTAFEMTDGCFDAYTDNEFYYDRNTKQNDETKQLKKYQDYFKKNFSNSITNPDEWILGFIPEELFINQGQYFYMGREYGFFVDNNGSEQLAFIFDSEISVNVNGDGYIEQKFSPLFYHTYKYSNGQVRIKSYNEKDRYFVKDVTFGAALGNLTYTNKEDEHYDAELDDGAFFISTNYHYAGTSLQSGLAEDGINVFTTAVSGALNLGGLVCPPLKVVSVAFDTIVSVVDLIDTCIKMNDNIARDYREVLTNGDYIGELYHTNKDAQLHGTTEHPAYSDGLRKLAIGKMETSMDNPVLLDMGNVHNVNCLYTIGTTSHWSTNFVGRIGLDIVKEKSAFDGTKIENAYENIVSSCFSVRTWEADEKPQTFERNKNYYIDIAPNTTKQIKVKADYSGDYTINAGGELFSIYDANNNLVAGDKDELTLFMDKNTELRVEISSANSAIHTKGGFYFTPKKLIVGGSENFVLSPSKNHIFSYVNNQAQSLCFDLNNSNLEIGIYDASGKELAYSSGKNLNYLYDAKSEIFIVVYNTSITNQNAVLSLNLQKTIKTNESFEYSILANETKYYIFDYFARGNYEIICNESVDVNIVNIYGQSVDKIENNAPYFIKVTNKNSYGLSGNICLKFSPLTVTFGNNNLSNNTEYVQFSPLSTQFYTFNGVTKVYDYNFNLINLSNNQAELIKDNTYYLLSNSYILTISVNFSELPINQNSSNVTDVNGVAYFKLNISIPTNYQINFSATSAEIYNENFNLIENLHNNSEVALNTGCHYIKVNSSVNSNVSIQIQLIGTELVIESQNIIHNNSTNYYIFNPKHSEGYKFYTIGDLNNSLTSKITIYKNTNSVLEKIAETTIGKYVELSINLQKNDTIIIAVELNNANGQAAIFTVEYINGGHNSEIENSFGIVESNSIQSIVKKGESKLFRFTPTISGTFDFYIEKSLSNTFNVQMFTETSTFGQDLAIYEQLNDSKVYKYKVALTEGINYYFVITYKNGLSLDDTVTVIVNREYSNVLLKTYITGTTSYYYGNPIKIAPCMSYDIALFDNDILLEDSLSLRYSVNNSVVKLNNNNIIVSGTSSIGQLITVSTTYLYTN